MRSILNYLILVGLLVGLTACGDEPAPNAGDPIPNVKAGLTAMYSGDLSGVDMYFTEEIQLSIRQIANESAEREARIDLENATFEITAKQSETVWTIVMRGEYTVWAYGQAEVRNTDEIGEIYIGVKVEDGIWKINGLEGTPTN